MFNDSIRKCFENESILCIVISICSENRRSSIMQEQRHSKRWHLIYYLAVFDRSSDDLLGYISDITTEGALIASESQIPLESMFSMKIELPSTIKKQKDIEFDARCVRSFHDSDSNLYNSGFQFITISSTDIARIEELISKFGFEN
jgi:hypothetical protein